MSRENVETVRQIYDESAEGRFGTLGHLVDPDVEYIRSGLKDENLTGLTVRARGIAQAFTAVMEWIEAFHDLRVEADRFTEVGDSVVVFTRHIGTTKVTGLPIDEEFTDVLTLRNGRVVRFEQYRDRAQALEAVGLRE